MRSGRPARGFTYLGLLVLVAASGALMAGFGVLWSHERQREKERELLWVGEQFRQAIGLYYQRTPGSVKRYPEKLEELLLDKRFLSTQRYLRRVFADPLTGKAEWGVVTAPSGGVMGVYSLAEGTPIRRGGFGEGMVGFEGASGYRGWEFVYRVPVGGGK